jgi:predicted ATPase
MFLQQPEVHLHPKAQAALGTFFVDLIAGTSRTLAVETHSDYLVDRVRQEVARGRISSDDVLILFFDKPKSETAVHPIQLDEHGNVLDPPPAYREFFLHEELNLLNRANS